MTHSQMIIEEFESKALVGNPLGDPISRKVPVYLPYAASDQPEVRFPVVFLLAAFAARG